MDAIKEQQEILAKNIIQNLEKRHMKGYYCHTPQEVLSLVSALIPSGTSVSWGGTMTLKELGVTDTLKSRDDITLLDGSLAKSQEEIDSLYRQVFSSDTYLMSSNAITVDGQLLNIDGTGNRVAALIFGPKQVLVIAGMNKVCRNLEEAMSRVRNIASPPNCIRLNKKTPCAANGTCADCLSPDCICNQIVTTRNSRDPERIKVILVEGNWGY